MQQARNTRTRLDLLRWKKQAVVKILKKDVAGLLNNMSVASEQHGRIEKLTDDPSRKDQGELSEHFG